MACTMGRSGRGGGAWARALVHGVMLDTANTNAAGNTQEPSEAPIRSSPRRVLHLHISRTPPLPHLPRALHDLEHEVVLQVGHKVAHLAAQLQALPLHALRGLALCEGWTRGGRQCGQELRRVCGWNEGKRELCKRAAVAPGPLRPGEGRVCKRLNRQVRGQGDEERL